MHLQKGTKIKPKITIKPITGKPGKKVKLIATVKDDETIYLNSENPNHRYFIIS